MTARRLGLFTFGLCLCPHQRQGIVGSGIRLTSSYAWAAWSQIRMGWLYKHGFLVPIASFNILNCKMLVTGQISPNQASVVSLSPPLRQAFRRILYQRSRTSRLNGIKHNMGVSAALRAVQREFCKWPATGTATSPASSPAETSMTATVAFLAITVAAGALPPSSSSSPPPLFPLV